MERNFLQIIYVGIRLSPSLRGVDFIQYGRLSDLYVFRAVASRTTNYCHHL